MNENSNKVVRQKKEIPALDFRQLGQLCLSNWYWILVSMVACVLIAGIYLWFAPSTVMVSGQERLCHVNRIGHA